MLVTESKPEDNDADVMIVMWVSVDGMAVVLAKDSPGKDPALEED